jgi:hypothetical protein
MRTRLLLVAALSALFVGGTATPALAKGPDRVEISGAGLAKPVVVDGAGEPGSADMLGLLATGSGLFLAMFGPDGSGELLTTAPAGPLGPRYTLRYRVPSDQPTPSTVVQDLYPYAAGGPVSYTRAGQVGFTSQRTFGGWHAAPATFGELLVRLGVPARSGDLVVAATPSPAAPAAVVSAPAPAEKHRSAAWYVVPALVLILGAAGLLGLRRRTGA